MVINEKKVRSPIVPVPVVVSEPKKIILDWDDDTVTYIGTKPIEIAVKPEIKTNPELTRFVNEIAELDRIQAHIKQTEPYVRIAFKKRQIIQEGTKVIATFCNTPKATPLNKVNHFSKFWKVPLRKMIKLLLANGRSQTTNVKHLMNQKFLTQEFQQDQEIIY